MSLRVGLKTLFLAIVSWMLTYVGLNLVPRNLGFSSTISTKECESFKLGSTRKEALAIVNDRTDLALVEWNPQTRNLKFIGNTGQFCNLDFDQNGLLTARHEGN